jgi:hypothetical protein
MKMYQNFLLFQTRRPKIAAGERLGLGSERMTTLKRRWWLC